jgi:hypothetical protein
LHVRRRSCGRDVEAGRLELDELYRLTADRTYVDFASKIARAIQKKQQPAEDAPAPDFAGTFYQGETTPASTRMEAHDSVIALSRFVGEADDWLIGPAREVARSTLGQQFDGDNDYWLGNPAKAEGGVRESLFVQGHTHRLRPARHERVAAPGADPARSGVGEIGPRMSDAPARALTRSGSREARDRNPPWEARPPPSMPVPRPRRGGACRGRAHAREGRR